MQQTLKLGPETKKWLGLNSETLPQSPDKLLAHLHTAIDRETITDLDTLLIIASELLLADQALLSTRLIQNHKNIRLMRREAHVIVLSRSHIINENALITALSERRLAGAVFDNLDNHWIEKSSKLWNMKNVIMTPHTSSMSSNLETDRFQIYRENINRFLNGRDFIRVADKHAGY